MLYYVVFFFFFVLYDASAIGAITILVVWCIFR